MDLKLVAKLVDCESLPSGIVGRDAQQGSLDTGTPLTEALSKVFLARTVEPYPRVGKLLDVGPLYGLDFRRKALSVINHEGKDQAIGVGWRAKPTLLLSAIH
jgi:hypothetical protein